MKTLIATLFFFFVFTLNYAQQTYTVNNETLELKTEVNGIVDLLSTVDNGKYRFFVKKANGTIIELKNTRDASNKYKEEYKEVLKSITENNNLNVNNVKLTTGSLKRFLDTYNKSQDSDYVNSSKTSKVNFRLGIFAGITNHPFVENISDGTFAQFSGELEVFGDTSNPIHSGFVQFRQTLGDSEDFSTTEISLGYRLRFLRKQGFNLFVQNRFASLNFNSSHLITSPISNTMVEVSNETIFDVPFIFGIGTDIKVSENSYISIIYDSLFGINTDDGDRFSTDVLVGYKINL